MENEEQYEEQTIKSENIYDGRLVKLRVDTVELPNMKYAKREIVDHRNGVGICPITENLTMYMVRQYRPGVNKSLLEIPAGLVEPGEAPKEAAKRELQEEVGFKPKQLDFICNAYSSPGFTNEQLSIFIARGLEKDPLPPDDTEFIEVEEYSLPDLYQMVLNLEIEDAKTIIGVLYAYYNIYLKEKNEVEKDED